MPQPPETTEPDQEPEPAFSAPVARARLRARQPIEALVEPDAEARARLARALGLSALRKVAFRVQLSPERRGDWRLEGHLGATLVQPCAITLEPVTTRIEEDVALRFVADPEALPEAGATPDEELELDAEAADVEPLAGGIDLGRVLTEALALATPLWPRAPGAALAEGAGRLAAHPPGAEATEPHPFAGLAGLRDALARSEEDEKPGAPEDETDD